MSLSFYKSHAKQLMQAKCIVILTVFVSFFANANTGPHIEKAGVENMWSLCIAHRPFDNEVLKKPAEINALLLAETLFQQQINGTVKDSTGNPIAGVSVQVKGSTIGTATDADGNFSVPAKQGSTLVFTSVGYIRQEIKIATQTQLSIVLIADLKNIEPEVVVTALGISKSDKKVGYATSKVSGELLNQAKEPNVANSLTGRVSGLNVSGVNSGPGASARILIRGVANFSSATGPLIILDGVPMDNTQQGSAGVYGGADMGDGISSINPDDIENVVVLKGSTASALYGTRAANGVIQITTKSGKGAKGFGVELSSNFTVNNVINITDYQKVYGHGIDGKRPQSFSDLPISGLNSWGERMDGKPMIALDGKTHPYSPVKNQWQKFYKIAPVSIQTLSVVNGGPNGSMRFSLSYNDNQSVIPNSNLKRYSAGLNLTQNILKQLKLSMTANYVNEAVNHRPFLNDMSRNPNFTMAILPANINPEHLKPGYNAANGYEYAMNSDGYQTNPWFAVDKFITNTKRNRLISSTTLRYDVVNHLYVQSRIGLDFISDNLFSIEPTGTGYKRTGGLDGQWQAQTTEMNIDGLVGYSTEIASGFSVDAAVGANIRKFNFEKIGVNGQQWKTPFLYSISNLVSTQPIYGFTKKQTNSAYYTVDFSIKNIFTLSTTGRYDVFSTLPAHNRAIFTPSVSGSFVFGQLINLPQLTFGKLRLAYAQTGGEADPYQTSTYYEIQPGTNGGIPFGNTLSQTPDVKNLKPYQLKEYEAGLELKWFGNRLGLDISYFNRVTTGELIAKAISVATGYASSYDALGSTKNSGIELTLTGTPVKLKKFVWDISFNYTQVNNTLESIGNPVGSTATIQKAGEGQYRPSVGPFSNGAFVGNIQGKPIAQIMAYDYQFDGSGNIIIGANGIPLRGALTPMGSGLPKHYGGLNNEFTLGHFNLSVFMDYRFGSKVISGTDFFSIYYGLNKNTLPGRETGIVVEGVTSDGKPNKVLLSAQNYYQGLVKNISTISVFDGSFIKLRQVAFGYSLPAQWLDGLPFQSINVSLVARNLLTLLRHTPNFDPEDNFSSLPGNAGLQGGGLPLTRTYGVNVNIKFKK